MTPKTRMACISPEGQIIGIGNSYREAVEDAEEPKRYEFVGVSAGVEVGDWIEKLHCTRLGVYVAESDIEEYF